jgi:ribonuclease G
LANWLYEAGIGENRAALVEGGTIRKARIELEPEADRPRFGDIHPARLVEIIVPHLSGRVDLDGGGEALLEGLPPRITQGAPLNVRIVREAIPEKGRLRPARAVPAVPGAPPRRGKTLLERIQASGIPVIECHPHEADRLEQAGWSEVLAEAASGDIAFEGGALRMSITPAMTLFDVDGPPPLETLALRAADAVAAAIVRHQVTGSIGVDFPSLGSRKSRGDVAAALDAALPQPFERTAMNGFGFVQIVRRRTRASLPELIQADPVGAAARAALRAAERIPPGSPRIVDVSAVVARRIARRGDWTEALARRCGAATQFVGPSDRPKEEVR